MDQSYPVPFISMGSSSKRRTVLETREKETYTEEALYVTPTEDDKEVTLVHKKITTVSKEVPTVQSSKFDFQLVPLDINLHKAT